jgi:ribulose-5-phosphate 4-epimerase/fuculose-1-phosphate aldolase
MALAPMTIYEELVTANRILARYGVVDAYGHVSVRDPDNPERFILSRSRSAGQVEIKDLMRFNMDGQALDGDDRSAYLERFIHAAVYAARPDANSVIHAHTEAVLPFSITEAPLAAVIRSASDIGTHVPRWDIRGHFGDRTNLLVSNMERAESLAATLGTNSMALMRGHGFVSCGWTLERTVATAVNIARNARVQYAALQLGGPIVMMSQGEIEACAESRGTTPSEEQLAANRRGWDLWTQEVHGSRGERSHE